MNDDKGLEREADMMGNRASIVAGAEVRRKEASDSDASFALSTASPLESVPSVLPSVPVVQRAIGFEYEFGTVETFRSTKLRTGWGDSFEGLEQLKKNEDLMSPRDGFRITADVPPSGAPANALSDLEIIIKEIDDRDPQGREQMGKTLEAVKKFLEDLKKKQGEKGKKAISAELFSGGQPSVFIRPTAPDSLDQGNFQATAGLSLGALFQIRSAADFAKIEKQEESESLNYPGRGAGSTSEPIWQACVTAIATSARKLNKREQEALTAVVSLIVDIAIAGQRKIDYPKVAAGSLMARTDFGTIIRQLPKAAQRWIAAKPKRWNKLLLSITNMFVKPSEVTEKDRVFAHKFLNEETPEVGIMLGEWFEQLAQKVPIDLLTPANLPEQYGEKQAEALESLGAYGSKMDPAMKPSSRERPIFEFRALASVEVKDLPAAGLGVWDYIAGAHKKPKASKEPLASKEEVF